MAEQKMSDRTESESLIGRPESVIDEIRLVIDEIRIVIGEIGISDRCDGTSTCGVAAIS
ncbi:hypothetical protein [Candidatus Sodalis pierantonius]|uniref:hypothetical protein n=1 Tax=Candidatus Sodalis pierantonii TaxID=1486991 RepID=UPI00130DAD85|nr:hypothetical protein [Candidatus Sodalis pierantonius]